MRPALIAGLLAILVAGCVVRTERTSAFSSSSTLTGPPGAAPSGHIVFKYSCRDRHAVLESDRVVLIFEDISPGQQQAFHFKRPDQAVQVEGEGNSSVTVACRLNLAELRFHSTYRDGTNTLEFGKHCIRFADRGRLLLAADQVIALTNGQRTVRIHGDKAAVEELRSSSL